MNKFYVYGLFEELDQNLDNCFYIGKGCGDRMNQHFRDHLLDESGSHVRNLYKVRKIKKLKRNGKSFYSRKIIDNLNEKEAFEKEKMLIDQVGLNNLTNLKKPGEEKFQSGKHHHLYGVTGEEHPAHQTGKDHPMYNKKFGKETRKKMSEANKGEKSNNNKLDKIEAKEIKWLSLNTDLIQKQISNIYDITIAQVSHIKNNKQWKHVEAKKPEQNYEEIFKEAD